MEMEKEIRNFVVENFLFGAKDTELAEHDSFLEKGIIDSTGVLEIVHFLESRYGIEVDDDDLVPNNLDSVENIVRFVARKQNGNEKGVPAL